MTTLPTPTLPITFADSIREITAEQHLRLNQAWMRETGLATSGHQIQAHLHRHYLFVEAGDVTGIRTSFNNLVESFNAQEAGEPLLAAVLAPAVRRIGTVEYADHTPADLEQTAAAVLATGVTYEALALAVEALKKNCGPS